MKNAYNSPDNLGELVIQQSRLPKRKLDQLLALTVFVLVWCLYILTSAPGTIFGDPTEYQFIPAVWGIAHPPGYAFYTLLAGVWQRVFPIGSIAFRTNILAGAAAAWTASRVVLIVSSVLRNHTSASRVTVTFVALLVALILSISPDVWQHAIHANAHIVSLAITSTQLWLLVRWSEEMNKRWLFVFAFTCGLGVAHHPITVWGLPAYGIYILMTHPRFIKEPGQLLLFIISGLSGLAPLFYLVLRSPDVPFGPTDMRTWEGFIRHTTAQGLRVNLFYYGLQDVFERTIVFISLLRLQYSFTFLLLILVGTYILVKSKVREGYLFSLFIIGHLTFTMNSVQDVMAYLLHVFMALTLPLAFGLVFILDWWNKRTSKLGYYLTMTAILCLVFYQIVGLFPLISLRDWRDADQSFYELVEQFKGKGDGVAYVSDWEHLTPFYYYTLVEDIVLKPEDVRPVYVTSGLPWTQAVFDNLVSGPVYLTNYRREIRDLGFRLRPVANMWQVLDPPALESVQPQNTLQSVDLDVGIQILGYDLPEQPVYPGDVIPFTLYAKTTISQTDIVMPYIVFNSTEQRWTTDSRRLTPEWLPEEIIVEKYHIYIPHTIDAGIYPLDLLFANLSRGNMELFYTDGSKQLNLGEIKVQSPSVKSTPKNLDKSLSIIGNDLSLVRASARSGIQNRVGIWQEPLTLDATRVLHLNLTWCALKHPQMSYTVFIHLINSDNIPVFGYDYTPLGGAFPTYLWFPKWLPGQQVIDPYRLEITPDVPPGLYWLEVGMYEMGSIRRIPLLDNNGSMTGDRLILGPVQIDQLEM